MKLDILQYKASRLDCFPTTVDDKVRTIATYLQTWNISSLVMGVSGGIDSAVVLALLVKVKREYLPNLDINAFCITFDTYDGVFDDWYVSQLESKFQKDVHFFWRDGSDALKALLGTVLNDSAAEPFGRDERYSDELAAQSSYALRYQMLFTAAQRLGAVTVGTTNLDEMGFVGWFGKNSDMVVDLQVISNWHKFEVVEAAKLLGVPTSIVERAPTGDLIDGSTDEENFGCTYDELSVLTAIHQQLGELPHWVKSKYPKVVELARANLHKYQGQTFNPVFIE